MTQTKLIIAAVLAGLGGAVVGAVAGGVIAAATCEGGLECLGDAVVGVGSGAIIVESAAMATVTYWVSGRQGNWFLALLVAFVLAVPVPFLLLLGFAAPLALLFFIAQVWACIKILTAPGRRPRRRRT